VRSRLLAGVGALSALAAAPQPVRRTIVPSDPGPVAVTLDADVYDRARPDLGDLRIVDDLGAEVPYLSSRRDVEPPPPPRAAAVLNRSFVRGRSASVTLDFGTPTRKNGLVLSLAGDDFRRRVQVEGRHRADAAWSTLVDTAYVFAVPGPPPVRFEQVALPDDDFELLRVTVFRGPDDPPLLEIRSVSLVSGTTSPSPEAPVTRARFSRVEDARKDTVLTVELGARAQPFRAVTLEVADARFFREVLVEPRPEAPSGRHRSADAAWLPAASGAIYRYEEDGRARERLRVEAGGRAAQLRLRIRNGADRPLDIRGLTVMAPVERVVFEARPGRRYALEYGVPARLAPSYDLGRTVGDAGAWIARARPATVGEPRAPEPARVPWTERHPALLWAGLLAAVLALGALTRRALRAAG
jgi:hypothetical protein